MIGESAEASASSVGLASQEARRRLEESGPNEISKGPSRSRWLILAGQFRGKWKNTPEGPAAWRRGVYVYRRRSLPYPMFDTFDHPDMNITAGARNVSTVPTQALTLLNNPFVLSQARFLADRVSREARDPAAQVSLAYQIALARPATEGETRIGVDLITKQSLSAFTHVLLNLDEFITRD